MQAPNTLDDRSMRCLRPLRSRMQNGNGDPSDEIPFVWKKENPHRAVSPLWDLRKRISRQHRLPLYLNVKDGKVTFYPIEDSYYQFLQYMNKLFTGKA